MDFVDQSLGLMVAELKAQGLDGNTVIIVTAKHGQSPINLATLRKLGDPITGVVGAGNIAHQTADTASLLWLNSPSDTSAAVAVLQAAGATVGISNSSQLLSGATLYARFGDPATSALAAAREPDVIVNADQGVL